MGSQRLPWAIAVIVQLLCQLDLVEVVNRTAMPAGQPEQPRFGKNQDAGPYAQNEATCYCQCEKPQVAVSEHDRLLAWGVNDIAEPGEVGKNVAGHAEAKDISTDCIATEDFVYGENGHQKDGHPPRIAVRIIE